MPIEILMPALSPTMTEGTLAQWMKQEGDTVSAGDVIAEIETDKATMEVEAVDEGVLGRIVVPEGTEGVKVNAVIAWLLEEGEDASALPAAGEAAAPEPERKTAPPSAEAESEPEPAPAPEPAGQTAAPAPAAEVPAAPAGESGRIAASPLARRMARQAGLELAAIAGSGPHGRIVKRDVEKALVAGAPAGEAPAARPAEMPAPGPASAPAAAAARPALAAAEPEDREIPHSNVRKVIARRLSEADRDVPQIYLSVDMEIDRLLAARREINETLDGMAKVSVNDMVIKAAALAMRQVPAVNAQWTETATIQRGAVDISVAVAYEGGLITPETGGIPRRELFGLQSRHVWRRSFHFDRQPAPGGDSGGRRRHAEGRGARRRDGGRHRHDLHPDLRPPRHRRSAGRAMASGLQGLRRAAPEHAGLAPGRPRRRRDRNRRRESPWPKIPTHPSISSSSAAGRAAMSPRSGRRSSA